MTLGRVVVIGLFVCACASEKSAADKTRTAAADSAKAAVPLRLSASEADSLSLRTGSSDRDLSGVISNATVVYVEASTDEIERMRTTTDSADFEVSADDLNFYRSNATQYLEDNHVPYTRVTGRRTLTFNVYGQPTKYDFAEVQLLDFIIVYDGNGAPKVLAPNDIEKVGGGV